MEHACGSHPRGLRPQATPPRLLLAVPPPDFESDPLLRGVPSLADCSFCSFRPGSGDKPGEGGTGQARFEAFSHTLCRKLPVSPPCLPAAEFFYLRPQGVGNRRCGVGLCFQVPEGAALFAQGAQETFLLGLLRGQSSVPLVELPGGLAQFALCQIPLLLDRRPLRGQFGRLRICTAPALLELALRQERLLEAHAQFCQFLLGDFGGPRVALLQAPQLGRSFREGLPHARLVEHLPVA
mmetsp:Transcript_44521/g.123257  ORF Transcript_44521/g.123257 Transcript_44521/m.123257 type:complete len:238 (-) Transcript_44521:194-907(-)